MRTLYDSVNPAAIPSTAAMVAGYIDGMYAWRPADWARFPRAVQVRIAVFASTNAGHVLDIETGDATPVQAPGWVQKRRAAGADPSVYCSMSLWPTVRAAFAAAHVPEPHYWVAGYPGGGPIIPAGAVAHQYADPATSGGDWDLSVVADYWPGVDGGAVALLQPDDHPAIQSDLETVLAGSWRFDGRNPVDMWRQTVASVFAIQASLAALAGALSAEEAAVLAAIKTVPAGGQVDVVALAASLAGPLAAALKPLLPAGTTPTQFFAALAGQLAK